MASKGKRKRQSTDLKMWSTKVPLGEMAVGGPWGAAPMHRDLRSIHMYMITSRQVDRRNEPTIYLALPTVQQVRNAERKRL